MSPPESTHAVFDDLHQLLLDRRQQLLEEVRRSEHAVQGVEGSGRIELAQLRTDQEVAQAEVERDLHELRDIDAALKRLREGQFGACIDCGGDIGAARLRAEPSALRCIACQQQIERQAART